MNMAMSLDKLLHLVTYSLVGLVVNTNIGQSDSPNMYSVTTY